MNKRILPVSSGLLIIAFLLNSCTLQKSNTVVQNSPTSIPTQEIAQKTRIWLDPALPNSFSEIISEDNKLLIVEDKSISDLQIEVSKGSSSSELGSFQRVYAIEAPYPTITDEISLEMIQRIWLGNANDDDSFNTIQVSQETRMIFDELWGTSSPSAVQTVAESQFASNDFTQMKTWAVVPFEQISPRWKVIRVNGLSPLDKPLNADMYALTVNFYLTAANTNSQIQAATEELKRILPTTNRDESKMTVLMMTGTTAITRAIAYKMEIKGLNYPIEAVKPWFENADLVHVSNEISFNPDCPFPDAYQHGLQFCASPKYIQTLKDLGVNVVEVTGNHENDYGPEYFISTLQTYHDLGWAVYGGGTTPEEARQPVKVEVNGNKIAFIGCNVAGPTSDWVTEDRAGTATCDMDYIHSQIQKLKSEGYVVITTFQHYEVYVYMYGELYAKDFQDAALAGADIVNGSQAHYAMGMQFVNNSFIHYGLGNFFFDQMSYDEVGEKIRREFIDRHIIYEGKYLNTELKTAMLTDWAQPVPMSEEDRSKFLMDIFKGSNWK